MQKKQHSRRSPGSLVDKSGLQCVDEMVLRVRESGEDSGGRCKIEG